VLDIHIRSEGYNDPGKAYPRSKAYIKVDGIDYSLQKRGFNVVVVDGETGVFLEARSFDTYADNSSGNHLRDFLNNLSGNKIVLVATQDSASKYMSPAIDALKRLGATDPLQVNYRDSFAFAGYAGVNKPQWITQERANRYLGPSEIFPQIPLPQPSYNSLVMHNSYLYMIAHMWNQLPAVTNSSTTLAQFRVFLEARSFDTYAESSSGYHLRDFLNNLSGNKIVLVATQDSASKHISPAIEALKRLGATDPLQGNYRDSFAFAGYAGVNKPQWITQKRADRYLGPTSLTPELLNANKIQNWSDVIHSETCDHYNIEVSLSFPCTSNPFCRPNYNQDDYQCVCKPGYSGVFCETGRFLSLSQLVRPKDAVDPAKQDGVVYRIPCECGKVDIGETGRPMQDRIKEHDRDIRLAPYGSKIVLVAVQDQGSHHMSSAIDALKRLGAKNAVQVQLRKPSWITQKHASRGKGPSEFTLMISLPAGKLRQLLPFMPPH
ncbi:unnamed protein product, partial [Pocillopora meandrina]